MDTDGVPLGLHHLQAAELLSASTPPWSAVSFSGHFLFTPVDRGGICLFQVSTTAWIRAGFVLDRNFVGPQRAVLTFLSR